MIYEPLIANSPMKYLGYPLRVPTCQQLCKFYIPLYLISVVMSNHRQMRIKKAKLAAPQRSAQLWPLQSLTRAPTLAGREGKSQLWSNLGTFDQKNTGFFNSRIPPGNRNIFETLFPFYWRSTSIKQNRIYIIFPLWNERLFFKKFEVFLYWGIFFIFSPQIIKNFSRDLGY